jgi:hypothetical protein
LSQQQPQEDSHSVQEFAEQFVESLQPRDERYETRLGDDFYVCTWPNGVKTWLFVYEVDGYRRRRTLGTYPELSLTDAREALFAARRLQQVEDELIERGLGEAVMRSGTEDERPATPAPVSRAPRHPPLAVRAARTLGTAAVGAALAIGGMFAYATFSTRPIPLPLASVGDAPATVPAKPATAPTTGKGSPADRPRASGGERTDTAATAGPGPAAADAGTSAANPQNEKLLALRESLAGTVSREALAENVANGEPYGELSDLLTLDPDEAKTVHYFTEVRGMQGRHLEHRWLHEDKLIERISLEPDDRWRSPLSSSLTIAGPGSEGRWSVELRDDAGELIEAHSFRVQRADAGATVP